MQAYCRQVELLQSIPGVDRIVAWTLIAELGTDPATFPDAEHCASWAGLTPGEDESAGKQKSQRCKPGNQYVQRVLAQSAWAVSRCKHGYLRAFFYRVKARRGWAKAIIAVAHKILVIAFTMLRDNQPYRERGDDYFDQLHPVRTAKRLVRRLEALGMEVQLVPRGAQSSN
jgi:transposase